ncbi:MAG: nucleoid-associated protein [Prevotellaceae bacterium]|nr:nucleoid-associated protein [Prevotellaceae bacterium]
MHNFPYTNIRHLSVHRVGNKTADEGVYCTKAGIEISTGLHDLLLGYFLTSFKSTEYFHLYHEESLLSNEIYATAQRIFERPNSLHAQSVLLAKYLYEQSTHPKIKSGELYVAYLADCLVDGEAVDAVGLFKSENKEPFLKVEQDNENFVMESELGINLHKLDKGCIIFNTERDKGYMVTVVDNTSRGAEASFWIDDFLHLCQRKDEYYNTQNVLTLCKNFVNNELPQQFDVSKVDQADFLNRSVKFFRENDNFDMDEFANEVIAQPDVIRSFNKYKVEYEKDFDIDIADSFAISDNAVKKQARVFKSVIKLDKNFHIYVHGNRELIERGMDEKGKFYKVYYKEEN